LEYTKTQAVEKMGRDTCKQPAELKSIALEEVEKKQSNAFSWIDPTQQ
jgi:hypothetical protein